MLPVGTGKKDWKTYSNLEFNRPYVLPLSSKNFSTFFPLPHIKHFNHPHDNDNNPKQFRKTKYTQTKELASCLEVKFLFLINSVCFPKFYLFLLLVSFSLQIHKTVNIIPSIIFIIIKLPSHEMICQIHRFVIIKCYLPSIEPVLFSLTFTPADSKANIFSDLQFFLLLSKGI